MFRSMLLLTPATFMAMVPTLSPSNEVATAIAAGAPHAVLAFKMLAIATIPSPESAEASYEQAKTTATTVHAAAEKAEKMHDHMLVELWMRCLRTLACQFGPTLLTEELPASESAAPVAPVDAATMAAASTKSSKNESATRSAALVAPTDAKAQGETRDASLPTPTPTPTLTLTPTRDLHVPAVIAEYTIANDDALMIATAQALRSKHNALGPVPSNTVLQLLGCLYTANNGKAFDALAYPMAIVDVVLSHLNANQYDVGAVFEILSGVWLRTYQGSRLLLRMYKRQRDAEGVAHVQATLHKLSCV